MPAPVPVVLSSTGGALVMAERIEKWMMLQRVLRISKFIITFIIFPNKIVDSFFFNTQPIRSRASDFTAGNPIYIYIYSFMQSGLRDSNVLHCK